MNKFIDYRLETYRLETYRQKDYQEDQTRQTSLDRWIQVDINQISQEPRDRNKIDDRFSGKGLNG